MNYENTIIRNFQRDMYGELVVLLRNRNEFIDKSLFKAILTASESMVFGWTLKKDAIKEASKKFEVTQKDIKKYIDLLSLQSTRYLKNKELNKLPKEHYSNLNKHKMTIK